MNRRELLQLGVGCLAGVPLTAARRRADVARPDHLPRHELAPGLEAPALDSQLLARGSARAGAPVLVHNHAGRTLELRSAWWDRDLSLAPGAAAWCRLTSGSGGNAAFSAAAGALHMRGLLPAATRNGDFDAEYTLSIHQWSPAGREAGACTTLGPRVLAASEPLAVRAAQRVRFQFFNASARRAVSLHLPGHEFEVRALDGVPLPRPVRAAHLALAPGERIDTRVDMHRPGRWVLGSLSRVEQQAGFGRVIDYADARGTPVAASPAPVHFSPAQCAIPADPPRGAEAAEQEIVLDDVAWQRRALRVEPGEPQRLVFPT